MVRRGQNRRSQTVPSLSAAIRLRFHHRRTDEPVWARRQFRPAAESRHSGLIRKLYDAVEEGRETVAVWGTGKPRREFIHVDDAADAAVFLLRHWSAEEPINVGTGEAIGSGELAETIARVVGLRGRFAFDLLKPGCPL